MMDKKFIGSGGLPRSGSTLLSSILSQNPNIHAEGNSAVCQMMWDLEQSCNIYCDEQLDANNRKQTQLDIISAIPHIYYKDVTKPIIIDKCRTWTLPANLYLMQKYITNDLKIIVLERPIIEIVKSFVNIRKQNNWEGDLEEGLLDDGSDPIVRSLDGVKWAKENNQNNTFLFIQYNDLINNTKEIINQVYKFIDEPIFEHDLNNIINKHPENDKVYNMIGLHDIRPTINRRDLDVVLTDATIKKCKALDNKCTSLS
jgi:sulfotransferase